MNAPPSVLRTSPEWQTNVPQASDPDCNGTPNDHVFMKFNAAIRDDDVDQKLEVRVFVDGVFVFPTEAPPATMATPERRTSDPICLDANVLFDKACSYVELLVSSEFRDGPGRDKEPVIPGDIGRTEWFVLGGSKNSPDTNPRLSCMARLDAGVP